MSAPWRDRSDSYTRGYVLGTMTVSPPMAVISALVFAITTSPVMAILVLLYVAASLLSAYMWYHG